MRRRAAAVFRSVFGSSPYSCSHDRTIWINTAVDLSLNQYGCNLVRILHNIGFA